MIGNLHCSVMNLLSLFLSNYKQIAIETDHVYSVAHLAHSKIGKVSFTYTLVHFLLAMVFINGTDVFIQMNIPWVSVVNRIEPQG